MKLNAGYRMHYCIKRAVFYTAVIALAFVCTIPLYWMARSSLMTNNDIYSMNPFIVWPFPMIWQNYQDAVNFMPFLRYTANTLLIVFSTIAGTILTSCMAAYAFSRIEWKGRQVCFFLILTSLMLPSTVTVVPQFLIWRHMNLVDTYFPLIVPAFLGGGAFNIFLLRQFFMGIPKEMDEAAKIDGAGPLRIFFQIIIPLAKSAVIVVGMFTFLGAWNDFFAPLIYLNSPEKFTLSLGLLEFRGNYVSKWNLLMAASSIVIAPCIVLFLIGQKYLIEGITLTGMKA